MKPLRSDPFISQLCRWAEMDDLVSVTPRQQNLTERFIVPILPELTEWMDVCRDRVDDKLGDRGSPRSERKPYPEGYCKEITQAMLGEIDFFIEKSSNRCAQMLSRFIQEGGVMKRIWGDLRGIYFQNAIQLGGIYLDVANDTVDIDKPRVEILPLAESGFRMIHEIEHFVSVAERYWQGELFPNTVIPALAPVLPVVRVKPSGSIRLEPDTRTLFSRNLLNDCRSARRYVGESLQQGRILPPVIAGQWIDSLKHLPESPLLQELCIEVNPTLLAFYFDRAGQHHAWYQTAPMLQRVIETMKAIHAIEKLPVWPHSSIKPIR